MFPYYALCLAAAIQILPVFGQSPSSGEKQIGNPATALKPININDFLAATGVHRRAAEDFSHLDLSTQAQLVYGRPGGRFSPVQRSPCKISRLIHRRRRAAFACQHDPLCPRWLADRYDGEIRAFD